MDGTRITCDDRALLGRPDPKRIHERHVSDVLPRLNQSVGSDGAGAPPVPEDINRQDLSSAQIPDPNTRRSAPHSPG